MVERLRSREVEPIGVVGVRDVDGLLGVGRLLGAGFYEWLLFGQVSTCLRDGMYDEGDYFHSAVLRGGLGHGRGARVTLALLAAQRGLALLLLQLIGLQLSFQYLAS